MAKSLFSVPIFFIVFRETLEAAIIVSVLLGLVEQLVFKDSLSPAPEGSDTGSKSASPPQSRLGTGLVEDDTVLRRRLLRKMRIQVRYLSAFRLQYTQRTTDICWLRYRTSHCSIHWCSVSPSSATSPLIGHCSDLP